MLQSIVSLLHSMKAWSCGKGQSHEALVGAIVGGNDEGETFSIVLSSVGPDWLLVAPLFDTMSGQIVEPVQGQLGQVSFPQSPIVRDVETMHPHVNSLRQVCVLWRSQRLAIVVTRRWERDLLAFVDSSHSSGL